MNFRPLERDESRVLIARHGTRGEQRVVLPKDTISEESYHRCSERGTAIREAGMKITEVITSPRGRAVKTAVAFAEGNADVDEGLAPFKTEVKVTDMSSGNPEVVAELKAFAKEHDIAPEQACMLFPLATASTCGEYLWRRSHEYAEVVKNNCTVAQNKTRLLVAHGGLLDLTICIILHPYETPELVPRLLPDRMMEMEDVVELIFSQSRLVEVNFLD